MTVSLSRMSKRIFSVKFTNLLMDYMSGRNIVEFPAANEMAKNKVQAAEIRFLYRADGFALQDWVCNSNAVTGLTGGAIGVI